MVLSKEIDIFKKKLNFSDAIQSLKCLDQVECPVSHHFADGQYIRETLIPKGTIAIGKKHKTEVVNILLKGKIMIYMGENEPIKELSAPHIFTSETGVQKIGYALEDTIWVNCHPTEHTDLEKIEKDVICQDEDMLLNSNIERIGE